MDGWEVVRSRAAELDMPGDPAAQSGIGRPSHAVHSAVDDVERFISILQTVTSTGDHSGVPVTPPEDADAVMAGCRLLRRLEAAVPEIVTGQPARRDQYWISSGKPPWVPPREPALSPAYFVALAGTTPASGTKPFGIGLYTSTGFLGTQGMWRAYLDINSASSLFLHPWHVWKLDVRQDVRICEIRTAAKWAELISRYPLATADLIYPDWPEVAKDYDAVHLTVRAIAAIQGLRLRMRQGLLAPSYWDVETTFWLRWSFSSVMPVEIVGPVRDYR